MPDNGKQIEDLQIAFKTSFVRNIGNGDNTSFWNDLWIGNNCLSSLFPRLFRLDARTNVTVKNVVAVPGINAAVPVINDAVIDHTAPTIQVQAADSEPSSAQTAAAHLIAATGFFTAVQEPVAAEGPSPEDVQRVAADRSYCWAWNRPPTGNHSEETIWNSLVPKKIELFAWRAFQKRIPVRMELDKRGIDLHSVRCPLCDDDLETVDHVLIFCKHAQEVWNRVFNWWKRGNFTLYSLREILRGHIDIWQAVLWSTAYFIWKNRNNKVFLDKSFNGPIALSEIQICSFDWISRRTKGCTLDWCVWLTNPDSYLH
ncbi:uncharacterized protein [Rutidosis leptorrhynchoides]|uniref:uncharacterized protein n=1 Tax=Rutidosis leptorrhynchoides TaxID=125765 RepID=UPI003A99DEB5